MSCRAPPEHGPSGGAPTARQLEVLVAIYRYRQEHDWAPTARELSDLFGWSGPAAAQDYFARLEAKRLITREPGLSRTVRLTESGKALAEAYLREHPVVPSPTSAGTGEGAAP